MDIVEIIESIHGEHPYMGTPCLIVRLSKCNLSCSYCDTPQRDDVKMQMDIPTLKEEILKHKLTNILITGGEPLLQMKELAALVDSLTDMNDSQAFTYIIETNGTLPIKNVLRPNVVVVMDIKSFKENFATEEANLLYLSSQDAVKFVSLTNEDYMKSKLLFQRLCLDHLEPMYIFSFDPSGAKAVVGDFVEWSKSYPLHRLRLQTQFHKLLNIA